MALISYLVQHLIWLSHYNLLLLTYTHLAWMKVTARNNPTSIASNIDPNQKPDSNVSPVGSITYRKYRDASTKEFTTYSTDVYKNSVARPYLDDGSWNLVHGIFRIPDHYRVLWEIGKHK